VIEAGSIYPGGSPAIFLEIAGVKGAIGILLIYGMLIGIIIKLFKSILLAKAYASATLFYWALVTFLYSTITGNITFLVSPFIYITLLLSLITLTLELRMKRRRISVGS